jgi:hypothetical protein
VFDGLVTRAPGLLLRAHVIQHPRGLLCEGFADDVELDQQQLVVNQLINGKIKTVPLAKSTVRGTNGLLTSSKATTPSLSARWSPMVPFEINWMAVWLWVWAAYRDRKVCDFLWRLFHHALPLGYNRRRFSDDVDCCVCSGQLETYEHLLRDCPSTRAVWAWFRRIWRSAFGTDPFPQDICRALFLCLPPRKNRKRARQRVLVRSIALGELLYAIWLQRCRCLFDKQPNEFAPLVIVAVARFRIRRALTTVSHPSSKYSSDRLVADIKRLENVLDDN